MGSKSPSTPDIRQLPANTGTNTIANNQSMIQRGFPVITDGNNNITSGLRRNDGSIVEGLGGQPLTAKVLVRSQACLLCLPMAWPAR